MDAVLVEELEPAAVDTGSEVVTAAAVGRRVERVVFGLGVNDEATEVRLVMAFSPLMKLERVIEVVIALRLVDVMYPRVVRLPPMPWLSRWLPEVTLCGK